MTTSYLLLCVRGETNKFIRPVLLATGRVNLTGTELHSSANPYACPLHDLQTAVELKLLVTSFVDESRVGFVPVYASFLHGSSYVIVAAK